MPAHEESSACKAQQDHLPILFHTFWSSYRLRIAVGITQHLDRCWEPSYEEAGMKPESWSSLSESNEELTDLELLLQASVQHGSQSFQV